MNGSRIPIRACPAPPTHHTPKAPGFLRLLLCCLALFHATARAQVYGAMDVWPANTAIEIGSSRQFGAYVPISPSTIQWEVNGIPGGSPTLGTISPSGLYAAPAVAPTPSTVTITARSTAYPASLASTPLRITRKYPWLWSASPGSLPAGAYQITFSGANLTPDAVLLANGTPIPTTYSSSTRLVGNGTAATAGTLAFAVALPGPGPVTGNVVNVTVTAPPQPPPVVVTLTPASASVATGGSQPFTASVTGSSNTAVTWSVNGTTGGSATFGTISPAGLYTAPGTLPNPPTVTIRATSVANPNAHAQASVTLSAPVVLLSWLDGARYLDQSSFGPSSASLLEVQTYGIEAHLEQQLAMPITPIPASARASMSALRQWRLHRYTVAPDQLRQRMAYALGQVTVTSASKLVNAGEIIPWLELLDQNAFGNYRNLLRDLTRSPSMGKYLDLANSNKPGAGTGANENYPRELLQLFTIGLWELNPDGTPYLEAGTPVPTYTQDTVVQLALALTGWTYATAPGATPQNNNWEYFGAPMEPRQANHDTRAKSFLGRSLPAGQSVEQDLEDVLDCLIHHPNTAPFIATRLIRSLVTSNPSGAYVQRVADVFRDNGQGTPGDLAAVLRAILLDPEARQETPGPDQGRLKDHILHVTGFVRALNGQLKPGQQLTYLFDNLGQSILNPPSVFNWFSPLYRIPGTNLFGPEFQIYSPTESVLRGNFIHALLTNPNGGDVFLDLTPFQADGNDLPTLVETVNQRLLHGRMSPALRQLLIQAAGPGYDARTRIETVLYLTALSAQYTVQY